MFFRLRAVLKPLLCSWLEGPFLAVLKKPGVYPVLGKRGSTQVAVGLMDLSRAGMYSLLSWFEWSKNAEKPSGHLLLQTA